jgi:hypothetical protein
VNPSENKRILQQHYHRQHNNPAAWALSAWDLEAASDVLFEKYQNNNTEDGPPLDLDHERLHIPATMLFGFAVENLLKGVLIKQHGDFAKARKAINDVEKGAWNHNLLVLAEATNYPLKEEQRRWLRTLSASIKWAGRYPTSLYVEDYTIEKQVNSGDNLTPSPIDSAGIKTLKPLVQWSRRHISNR